MFDFNLDIFFNAVATAALGLLIIVALINSIRHGIIHRHPSPSKQQSTSIPINKTPRSDKRLRNRLLAIALPIIPAVLIISISLSVYFVRANTGATVSNPASATKINNKCTKTEGYNNPQEFQRAVSLIEQRTVQYIQKAYNLNPSDFDDKFDQLFVEQMMKSTSISQPTDPNIVLNYGLRHLKNCLDINYVSDDTQMTNVEGYFTFNKSSDVNDLIIRVSKKFDQSDDLITSFLLVHEITHAINYSVFGVNHTATKDDCLNDETWAYTTQLFFLTAINNEELNSISSRLRVSQSPEMSFLKGLLDSIIVPDGKRWEGWMDLQPKVYSYVTSNPVYQRLCTENP